MGPFVVWAFYYLLVSAVPMLIAANPTELGPEVFAGTMVWRLLTNGGIVYVAFGELAMKGHYLSLETGMAGYGISLGLAAVGLVMFFKNCDPDFDRSLFWRGKLGKQRTRDCWSDDEIWERTFKTKDEEKWKGWVETIHPTYLPFDLMTPWIKSLVEKYGDEGVERPRWLDRGNESIFIKRVAEIYIWKGEDEVVEVDEALVKLFGKSSADLGMGEDGLSLTFINSKKSRGKGFGGNKVKPDF